MTEFVPAGWTLIPLDAWTRRYTLGNEFFPHLKLTEVVLVCPRCATPGSIGSDHTIDNKGLVRPGIVCRNPACAWRGSVMLEDFDPDTTAADYMPAPRFGVGV